MRTTALVGLAAALTFIVSPGRARACAIIGGEGVKANGEEVLIVWDAKTHREHFVRHLSFRDAKRDFGFLVPTPGRPELAEADDAVFGRLFDIYRTPPPPPDNGLMETLGFRSHGAAAAAPVQVVEQRRVAGLDATVLKASDAAALNAWLGQHHYPASPALARYLKPYVEKGYFVTAFWFDPGMVVPVEGTFGTKAVRMSFDTDLPFFPYAEPEDAPTVRDRIFRVSVVAPQRMTAKLRGNTAWNDVAPPDQIYTHPRTGFAGDAKLSKALKGAIPAADIPGRAWLTTFEDPASVRGREDLFFVPASDQSPVPSSIGFPVQ